MMFLITILITSVSPLMTKDIEVTPVESQVLPFHLGPGRIIENQHTFIHFIDTNSLSELLDDTINQFKTINNTFNSTTPSKTNIYKNTLENLLTHTNHIITEAKIKLINIKPNTRNKRGLLDIIGKTSKFFYLGLWTPMGGGGEAPQTSESSLMKGGCHRVPWATTVTVSVVRSAERWLVDSASAGTSRWTADDARGGWSMSPAQGPFGGALMMV
jgi:hypothetical protein